MTNGKDFIQQSADFEEFNPESKMESAKKEMYQKRLVEKLKDPEFRKIEGFPHSTDEAILALSDPPYYTACPNPFMDEILLEWQQERKELRKDLGLPDDENLADDFSVYHREPFAADVSEGKNDPIYNAHSYHTKVPHKAIMRYILHYTDPGDIVFDGFCGTGMTGVAAQLCGDKKVVESLGYRVDKKGIIYDGEKAFSHLGARKAVLNDLSPAATFITYNYNTPVDVKAFEQEAKRILAEVEKDCGWMYETWHPNCVDPNRVKGTINYTVWSDVFRCPHCSTEMVFWDVAVETVSKKINKQWDCPSCGSQLSKSTKKNSGILKVERVMDTIYDHNINTTIQQVRQVPVLIRYSINKKHFEKQPDSNDIELLKKIECYDIETNYPKTSMLNKGSNWGDTWRSGYHSGITHVHHFFTKRNLSILSLIFHKLFSENNKQFHPLIFTFEQVIMGMSKWARYVPSHFSQVNQGLSGTLYIGSQIVEANPNYILDGKIKRLIKFFNNSSNYFSSTLTSTQSSTIDIISKFNSIDYIFIDPPFGDNLMYSELNYIFESWLKVLTNSKKEAIINSSQNKTIGEYELLIRLSFEKFFYTLKPGHWITIEFHNSQNAVWNAIQEAVMQAGFIIADVRTLDKMQSTFKQVTSTAAVKQDLVISAYKPSSTFENQFSSKGGTLQGAWGFIRQHLEQLPQPGIKNNNIEIQGERMPYLLYDRMVAFHLVRGLTIPLSAAEFYQGLSQHFLTRDGMVFTASQASTYDQLRLKAERVQQMSIFVTDEASAIQWLISELDPENGHGPQTYAEIQPKFLKQLFQERYEKLPELQIVLAQNFLQDEKERWYAPDPENAAHLEALRERDLLREFNEYAVGNGRLKIFRAEAVKAGFSKAWADHDYARIIKVAERLPDQALQEDTKLKLYYDNALNRAPETSKQERLL